MNDFDEYLVAGEPSKRDRAYGWATAIGLQDVDGLKVSAFLLNTAKRNIEGEITQSEAESPSPRPNVSAKNCATAFFRFKVFLGSLCLWYNLRPYEI